MGGWRKRRLLAAGLVLVLLLVFAPPFIHLKTLHDTIVRSISDATGHAIKVGDVGVQFLPQPGLVLSNFVVLDDPAFSAEPVLRADQVVARPRLSSLWRGRLEIGTLSLQDASLNLVRNAQGRWNLESLLQRATHTPAAPTGKARAEARPRFPYIEGARARINFKSGQEKKVYALSDAEFALWLEAENVWNMRLKAQPVRTDANLSDTGRVIVEASFRPADQLRDTPLSVRFLLDRAQLGQLTRLVYGRDRGWRGATYVNATVTGTPAALAITADLTLDDFRRYDILSGQDLRVTAHCSARYLGFEELSDIDCRVPQQNGFVAVRGSVSGLRGVRNYDLSVAASDVPMASLVRFARHAKRGLPEDLDAEGSVAAAFTLRSASDAGATWAGGGSAEDVRIRSRELPQPLSIGKVSFAIAEPRLAQARPLRRPLGSQAPPRQFVIGPFSVPLGGSSPASLRATLTRTGYTAEIQGDAELERLLAVVRALGGRAPRLQSSGTAAVDLQLAGKWAGFAPLDSTGTLQLQNVTAQVPGINAPLKLKFALVQLTPDEVKVEKIAATFAGAHSDWDGWLAFARACDSLACPVRLELHADQLSTDELNRLFNPRQRHRAWYQIGSQSPTLARARIDGRVAINHLGMKSVTLNSVAAQIAMGDGKLHLSNLHGDLLGGKLRADWQVTFTGEMPAYAGSGQIRGASVAQVSALAHNGWATGTLNLDFRLAATGWNARELAESAAAGIGFELDDGVLQHIRLAAGPPVHARKLWGHATWRDSRLEITSCQLQTPTSLYTLTGTAGQQLDLKLIGGNASGNSPGFSVSGPLDKPLVEALPAPETQVSEAR